MGMHHTGCAVILTLVAALAGAQAPAAPAPAPSELRLVGDALTATVVVSDGRLVGERLALKGSAPDSPAVELTTDAGFALEVVWTGWRAPGKANNADNLCVFTAADFRVREMQQRETPDGPELVLTLEGPEALGLEVRYTLPRAGTLLRRQLCVFDPKRRNHFLHALATIDAGVRNAGVTLNSGSFGQPVAFLVPGGGAFAGLEWPAADNRLSSDAAGAHLRCAEEIGELIGTEGVRGASAIIALTPDTRVKHWFGRYLDTVRVAKLRPYTLYNSWYDLRSAEYPRVRPEQVMNEANVKRIVRLLRENMTERHGITLDACVLDDGWDIYRSDWVLRPVQFPNGLKPIIDELAKTKTRLGLWFGPTGGYSLRQERIGWMREHGYEVVGNQLWLAGPKYKELLRKRVTDFSKQGVAYYKWDGIQFLGSDPGLGTPPGVYARRATLKAVRELAAAARAVNSDMFLNITSGTWLSPWWLAIADQIWMDGEDYGSADVPSISMRDSSITYRDLVLYEDFHIKGLWFPLANLMTHGVLKGTIDVEEIGQGEPLAKFADEMVFYLARGVTMYELYISPDVLTDGEWRVLAESLRWARDRFPVLASTEMIGGNPYKREAYGYAHFDGARGVLAVRNPDIAPTTLRVTLDPAHGLEPGARELVLERVYPTRWVSPRLWTAGDVVDLPLAGYEAAVYELCPLAEVSEPLLADVVFETRNAKDRQTTVAVLAVGPTPKVLNPSRLASIEVAGVAATPEKLTKVVLPSPPLAQRVEVGRDGDAAMRVAFELAGSARQATLAVLLKPAPGQGDVGNPEVAVELDGTVITPERVEAKGVWTWVTLPVRVGSHVARFRVSPAKGSSTWAGSASVWLSGAQAVAPAFVELEGVAAIANRPLPPHGRGPAELPVTLHLGGTELAAR
jgi:hypothetical protein